MTLYLNRERMRVVQRDDRGRVTFRKTYKQGQEVNPDHLNVGSEERLLASGTLVESKDDVKKWQGYRRSFGAPMLTGAATGEAGDHADLGDAPETDGGESEVGEDGETTLDAPDPDADESNPDDGGEDDDGLPDDEAEHQVDQFDAMDYGELQDAAKNHEPPIAANQSAAELRAALRA